MPSRRGVTFDELCAFALTLPGVERSTSFGTPALKVKKRFMARLRPEDPTVLVLTQVHEDEQRFLFETQPGVFFTTDHYRGHPTVLIRLSQVDCAELFSMLEQSWRRLATPRLLAERDGASSAGRAPSRRRRGGARAAG